MSTDSMDRALRVVQEKNLTCEDRGALLVDLTKFKMDRAIVRKAGELYHAQVIVRADLCRRNDNLPHP